VENLKTKKKNLVDWVGALKTYCKGNIQDLSPTHSQGGEGGRCANPFDRRGKKVNPQKNKKGERWVWNPYSILGQREKIRRRGGSKLKNS